MLGEKILRHIARNYAGCDESELQFDTPLIELNIIDSSALFDLVDFIRRETGVAIPIKDVSPTNFGTIQNIVELVTRVQGHSDHNV